jgi:preprotein translocase subunit SecD
VESRLNGSETARLSLSSELELFQSTSRRNEETIQGYEREVSIKDNTINDLREKIKLVKEESYKIQIELHEYQKMAELEDMFDSQLTMIQNAIKRLVKQK